jgi:hypothetical protein
MLRLRVGTLGALILSSPAGAPVTPFPGGFRTQAITTGNGSTIHVRKGGPEPRSSRARTPRVTSFPSAVAPDVRAQGTRDGPD